MDLSLLAALTAAFAWGTYLVPLRRMPKCTPLFFQLLNSIGILLSSLLVLPFIQVFQLSWWGVLSGLMWSAGSVMSLWAVRREGLAAASGRWMGSGVLVSVLWGMLFFGERFSSMLWGFFGMGLLLIGLLGLVAMQAFSRNTKQKSSEEKLVGGNLSLLVGVIFGSYLVPLNLSGLDSFSFLPSMVLGIILAAFFVFILFKPPVYKPALFWGVGSGMLWNTANICSFIAIGGLGMSVGFPLTQLALFVSILWGVLLFKEVKGTKMLILLTISACVLFSGAILMALSK